MPRWLPKLGHEEQNRCGCAFPVVCRHSAIEHRVAGADTNAYLVMAAGLLGAVLAGIEGNMQPPSPIRAVLMALIMHAEITTFVAGLVDAI